MDASTTDGLEKLLYEAGIMPGVQAKVQEKSKPWQLDEIQALIQERRNSISSLEIYLIYQR